MNTEKEDIVEKEKKDDVSSNNGSFSFALRDGLEVIRIENDGKFFVKGKEVAEDIEVYVAFKSFLENAHNPDDFKPLDLTKPSYTELENEMTMLKHKLMVAHEQASKIIISLEE